MKCSVRVCDTIAGCYFEFVECAVQWSALYCGACALRSPVCVCVSVRAQRLYQCSLGSVCSGGAAVVWHEGQR